MDGFNVEALKTAGLSTAELTAVLSETQVEDVDCDGAAVGAACRSRLGRGRTACGCTTTVWTRARPMASTVRTDTE